MLSEQSSTPRYWIRCGKYPANTQRNKRVIITSKRRFDIMITCLLCSDCTVGHGKDFELALGGWIMEVHCVKYVEKKYLVMTESHRINCRLQLTVRILLYRQIQTRTDYSLPKPTFLFRQWTTRPRSVNVNLFHLFHNPSMDKWINAIESVGRNYLSIIKLQP